MTQADDNSGCFCKESGTSTHARVYTHTHTRTHTKPGISGLAKVLIKSIIETLTNVLPNEAETVAHPPQGSPLEMVPRLSS